MKLGGKIAVVTGGGQGLGRSIALELSSQGADVVLAEIDERRGQETAREIQGRGGKAVAIATDCDRRVFRRENGARGAGRQGAD